MSDKAILTCPECGAPVNQTCLHCGLDWCDGASSCDNTWIGYEHHKVCGYQIADKRFIELNKREKNICEK